MWHVGKGKAGREGEIMVEAVSLRARLRSSFLHLQFETGWFTLWPRNVGISSMTRYTRTQSSTQTAPRDCLRRHRCEWLEPVRMCRCHCCQLRSDCCADHPSLGGWGGWESLSGTST